MSRFMLISKLKHNWHHTEAFYLIDETENHLHDALLMLSGFKD